MNQNNSLHNPKPNRSLLILLALLAFAIAGGLLAWNSPLLGRHLPTADVTLFPTPPRLLLQLATQPSLQVDVLPLSTPQAALDAAALPGTAGAADVLPAAAAEPPQPACAGPAQLLVLGLGIDLNAQSDVIRLVRIDFVSRKARILSIPRDFVVKIPGFEQYDVDMTRISAAYGYGEFYNGEGKGNGVIATANTVYANYGVQADRYVVVQMRHAAKWVDRLGGVDVVLEKAVDSTKDTVPFIGAGAQHFNGEQALNFFLVRYPDTDIDRINRQSLLLKALYAKAVGTLNVVQLTGLGLEAAGDKAVQTDLSAGEIYALACLGKLMTEADIEFVEIPREMYHNATTQGGSSVLIPHAEVLQFIQEMMGVSAK